MFGVTFSNKELFVHMELSADFIDSFCNDDVFTIVSVQDRVSRVWRLHFRMVQYVRSIGYFDLYMSWSGEASKP